MKLAELALFVFHTSFNSTQGVLGLFQVGDEVTVLHESSLVRRMQSGQIGIPEQIIAVSTSTFLHIKDDQCFL